ncbi:MAG: PIN domain-containing protein [Thermoplasmatota archaeon]
MRSVGIDTWAFVEMELNGPRASEVEAKLAGVRRPFTVRDVVVETYGFIARRAGTDVARNWWRELRVDELPILTPPLEDLSLLADGVSADARLSLTDLSLVAAARSRGCKLIASGDREFRKLGLDPIFVPG